VLVHQGTVEQGEALLARLWPDASAISDPERLLYAAFGLGRGRLGQLLGPATWLPGLRALSKRHFVGRPVGDPLTMPGVFLVEGARVLWAHPFGHAGDQPSTTELVSAVQALEGS
jgi:hypothetical protein